MNAPPTAEHRKSERYTYLGQARIGWPGTGVLQPASVLNLSASGCLIHVGSLSDFPVRSVIHSSFASGGFTFDSLATVRRTDQHGALIGISFLNLNPGARLNLLELIAHDVPPTPTAH
jgi:hypothetical protein